MNSFPRSLLGAAIASILAAPAVVWAQSADATLRGNAPANADVTARNVATGVTRRTKANASGVYTLAGLPPGTYRVDAGAGTETTVTLSVASTAGPGISAVSAESPLGRSTETTGRSDAFRSATIVSASPASGPLTPVPNNASTTRSDPSTSDP